MSNYNVVTNWVGLDSLEDDDPSKVISGSVFETEFKTIETSLNSKQDTLIIQNDNGMNDPTSTAVASSASIKAYVDAEVLTTRAYRGTRTTLFTGSEGSANDITLDFPTEVTGWDYFDELVFFMTSDGDTWLTVYRVDVLDILEASSLSPTNDLLVYSYGEVYWKFDVADKAVINTVDESATMKKIVGIKYE